MQLHFSVSSHTHFAGIIVNFGLANNIAFLIEGKQALDLGLLVH